MAMDFTRAIESYIERHWEDAVHLAEERFSGQEPGTYEHIQKIKQYAQFTIINGLVSKKGEWLDARELHYALDQFNWRTAQIDYFKILDYQNPSVLQEARLMIDAGR